MVPDSRSAERNYHVLLLIAKIEFKITKIFGIELSFLN